MSGLQVSIMLAVAVLVGTASAQLLALLYHWAFWAVFTRRRWHKGPPPHIGWWNASSVRDPFLWMWWNGEKWTLMRSPVARRPEHRYGLLGAVEWTDYYPENARVPRVDPRKAENADSP